MKKIITIVVLLSAMFLFSDEFSFESPAGNFKVSVEGSSSSSSSTSSVVDEIAKRVEYLQEKYWAKLNKLDQKRATKIIDQIYELLALLPEDVTIAVEDKTKQKTQNSGVNVSFNITGMESMQQKTTQQSQPVVEEKTPQSQPVVEEKTPQSQPVIEEKTPQSQPVIQETHQAMSNSEFQKLLQNVEDESFADDQISVVRIAVKNRYFTINQLIQLIDVFSFSDDKIQCVQIVYPKVVDKDNAYNLLGAFTYSSDKKQVESIINQ